MRQIENDAEPLAFADQFTTKGGQAFRRGAAGRENAAVTSRVAAHMSEAKDAQPQFVKNSQQIESGIEWFGSFHRNQ